MLISPSNIKQKIFEINSANKFNELSLSVFHYQAKHNAVYAEYIKRINLEIDSIDSVDKIPYLPIQFFKSREVISTNKNVEKIFKSSGTTVSGRSCHFVSDLDLYEASFKNCFRYFYGDIEDYVVLGLLPSYQEQGDSSLVYMVDKFIEMSTHSESGYCLNDKDDTVALLNKLSLKKSKVLLIGVTYALLDLLEKTSFSLNDHFIIMETGGMKGRRKELTKNDLYKRLKKGFGVKKIHSEYGMTELLSQAYSKGGAQYFTPPWMKVFVRDINDPLSFQNKNKSGGINIIDLANFNSCSFIATQDLGRLNTQENSFEILGRFDNSDVRGCNLLVAD